MAPLKALRAVLLGRGRRLEYWLVLALMAGFVLAMVLAPTATSRLLLILASQIIWMLAASRRLRDIGWSAWIAAWPLGLVILVFIAAVLAPPSRNGVVQTALVVVLSAAPFVWLVFALLIGAWKPKPPAPPTPQAQAEVFG